MQTVRGSNVISLAAEGQQRVRVSPELLSSPHSAPDKCFSVSLSSFSPQQELRPPE